jgi:ABC-type antimicrobial peptide transport system permease subunit
MGMVRLGLKNLLRNKLRLAIVVLLIGFPFFLLLVIRAVGSNVRDQTEHLKRTVDVALQARGRGSLSHVNMVGNERLLPPETVATIKGIEHVAKVEPYLLAMNPTDSPNFAMHVGLNPGDTPRLESHGEAGSPRIIAGRDLTPEDAGQPVAIIGQGYARWAGITPENLATATFTVDPSRSNPVIFSLDRPKRELRVVGIYASGYVFGDLQLFMPLDIFRDIYGVPSEYSWLFVTAESADHVSAVEARMREALGDRADIIATKSAAAFESGTTSTIDRIGWGVALSAVVLMAIVIFFVMLIVVRERAREIGTLKAMGASTGSITVQVLTEAFGLSLIGGLLGLVLFQAVGRAVAGRLFVLGLAPFLPAQYRDTLFASLTLSSGIDLPTIGLALVVSTAVATAGSAYGIWQVARLSPVEAMKHA